jgi:hypothetical protein
MVPRNEILIGKGEIKACRALTGKHGKPKMTVDLQGIYPAQLYGLGKSGFTVTPIDFYRERCIIRS